MFRADPRHARHAVQGRQQPRGAVDGKRGIRQVRPIRTERAAQEQHPVAPLSKGRRPRKPIDPKRRDAGGKATRRVFAMRNAQIAFGQHQGAKPPRAARAQGGPLWIEAEFDPLGYVSGGNRVQIALVQRRGEQDAPAGRTARHLADREIRRARQRIMRRDRRRAAVRHQELARLAARLGDAIGKSQSEQPPAGLHIDTLAVGGAAGLAAERARQGAGIIGARRPILAEAGDAFAQVRRVPAKATFDDDRGDLGGEVGFSGCARQHHHPGKARRQGEGADAAARLAHPAIGVEGPDGAEHDPRFGQGRGRWEVEPQQIALGAAGTPGRAVQQQPGEIGREDGRLGKRLQRAGAGLLPEAVADTRLGAAGTPAPLIGGGAAHPHRLQAGQSETRLVARDPGEAAVDDDADPFDRQRRFGDRGRQHDLADARGRRRHRLILRPAIHRGEKRHHQATRAEIACRKPFGDAQDLALSGKKHEKGAAFVRQRAQHRAGDGLLDALHGVATDVERRHGEGAALRFDHRRAFQQPAHARAIERRRHDEKVQVGPQSPGIERQGKAEIGIERALVIFVEDHRRDPLQAGIVQDHADENALRHDLDPCRSGYRALEAYAQAHRLADAFAERRGHPLRRRTRRQPPRFQHDDRLAGHPGFVEQHQRNPRRLAGAGRRHEDGRGALTQCGQQGRQGLVDGQGSVVAAERHAGGMARESGAVKPRSRR